MKKTKCVDFFLGKIATLALDIQFDTELAKRHALGAKQVGGGESLLSILRFWKPSSVTSSAMLTNYCFFSAA